MSHSKEKLQVEEQRLPKCCRCRHHGHVVAKKGHKLCPFLGCQCRSCAVIDRRSEVKAYHRRLKQVPSNVQASNGLGGAGAVDLTVNGPSGSVATTAASAAASSDSDSPGTGSPRRGANGGQEPSAGMEGRDQPSKAQNSSGFDVESVPFIPFPFVDSKIYPRRFPVSGQYFPNMPWMLPPSAGFHSRQPVMFQRGPMPYSSPAGLAYTPNYRQYFLGVAPLPQLGAYRQPVFSTQQPPLLPTQQQPMQQWPLLPTQQQPMQQRPLLPTQQLPMQQPMQQQPLVLMQQRPLLPTQQWPLFPMQQLPKQQQPLGPKGERQDHLHDSGK